MKNSLLNFSFLLFFLICGQTGNAQSNGISIKVISVVTSANIDEINDNTDYSSGHPAFEYSTSSDGYIRFLFEVENNTGTDAEWILKRFSFPNVNSNWTDHFETSFCFPYSELNPYCIPNQGALVVSNNSSSQFVFEIFPQEEPAMGSYRLYLGNDCENVLDSVTINMYVQSTNGLTPLKNQNSINNYTVSPNPASDFIQLKTPITSPEFVVHFYSVAGEKLAQKVVQKEQNIDVSKMQDGVYFLQVEANGVLYEKEKIVINR